MKIAILTTDNREHYRDFKNPAPYFGTAPEALLQGFAELGGAEIHVVSCTQEPVKSPGKIAENIWYHNRHVPKIGWLRTMYQGCIRATREVLREIEPDIVHGQGTERDCAMSAVLSGFPNVLTIHGNMAEMARLFRSRIGSYNWLTARLEDFAFRRTAGVFCNSGYTESLVRPRTRKIWRVPNALRREFFTLLPDRVRPALLINIGVITQRKRQMKLLDVAANLHRRGLKFEFHFIGYIAPGDPYGVEFLKRIKPLSDMGCARYLGMFPAPELIRKLDAAAGLIHFPSEEAFGLVVAEGMARRLKFFGSKVGGIPDIAKDVPGAELLAAEDWDGLTESIARWLGEGCPPLPPAAIDVMQERFHPATIARRHLEIYREVLNSCS